MTYKKIPQLDNLWISSGYGAGLKKTFFKWYELGLLGCGIDSVDWINLEPFIIWPGNLDDIKIELDRELERIGFVPGGGSCLLPYNLNNYQFFTHYQYFSKKYIQEDILRNFKFQHEYDKWVIENLSRPIWQTVLMAKSQSQNYWLDKHKHGAKWNSSYHIPLTQKWIDSLELYLFKSIGRVVIYKSNAGTSVPIHRDYPASEHCAHFVNFQIGEKTRPTFVYDEVAKQKIYTTSKAYMFNECDCHGVDSIDEDSFTIRVDGTFQDEILKQLKFENGQVFGKNSQSFYKVNNVEIFDPVE